MATRERVVRAINRVVVPAYLAMLRARRDPAGLLMSPRVVDDPYGVYDRLRQRGPVVRTAIGGVVVTGHGEAASVLRDPQYVVSPRRAKRFKPPPVPAPDSPEALQPDDRSILLSMDPPDHTRVRQFVSRAFTPRAIEELVAVTEEVVDRLVGGLAERTGFEVMSELAYPVPVAVICAILGVPTSEGSRVRRWGYDIAPTLDFTPSPKLVARAEASGAEGGEYFLDLVARRRRDPGEDLLSILVTAQAEGAELSDQELLGTCVLILLAGFVTTVNLIGSGLAALLEHPAELERLRDDPALIPNAIDEMLRYDSPVQATGRIAAEATTVGDARVEAGEQVIVLLGAANRDPQVFPEPARLVVDRPNANHHVSFGGGAHHCLGAALARMEGRVVFEALVKRFSRISLAAPPVRRPIFNLRGFETLRVDVRR